MKTTTAPILNRLPARISLPEGVREISVGHDVTSSGVMTLVMAWGDASEAWVLSTSHVPLASEPTALNGDRGYRDALHLVRMGHTSAAAIAAALGGCSPDGEQGNVWALYDARLRTHLAAGKPKAKAKAPAAFPPPEPMRGAGVETDDEDDSDDDLRDDAIQILGLHSVVVSVRALIEIADIDRRTIRRWVKKGMEYAGTVQNASFDLHLVYGFLTDRTVLPRPASNHTISRVGRYIEACRLHVEESA